MHTPVVIRFSDIAQQQLEAARGRYGTGRATEMFDSDLDVATATISLWQQDPAQRWRIAISFRRFPCTLYFETVAPGEVRVQAVLINPEGLGPLSRFLRAPGAGMPRRFGMGAMLSFMLAFAALYWVLKAFRVAPLWMVVLVLYFVALGVGQALLFRGREPRLASVIVGAVFCPAAALVLSLPAFAAIHPRDTWVLAVMSLLVLGPLTGYAFGGLLAGLFLEKADLSTYRRVVAPADGRAP